MLTRRTLLQASLSSAGLTLLPCSGALGLSNRLSTDLKGSDLIYLTPILSNGQESNCQAEIWYIWDGSDIYVCTDSGSWRVQAVANGLQEARIWVGDLGNWKRSNGKYKTLPAMDAHCSIVTDTAVHAMALEKFGNKYPFGWIKYGPIFRDGLASGARTLLKYHPVSA
ncbi:MAG: hypothetical protein HOC23_03530 [Halieaceae bacterium]|nr:hypothetical protein [Halieaceae bacterium]